MALHYIEVTLGKPGVGSLKYLIFIVFFISFCDTVSFSKPLIYLINLHCIKIIWHRHRLRTENKHEWRSERRRKIEVRKESVENSIRIKLLCNLQRSAFVCVSFACMHSHGPNRYTEPNWVQRRILCADSCMCAAPHFSLSLSL